MIAAVLVLITSACGSIEEAGDTATSTTREVTPTTARAPSTTSTTLAAGIDDKVIAACAASCAGEVVAGAAPYAGPNPHPVVLLDPMGGESEWIDLLPREWWPVEVSDVQLVAVLGFEEEVVIEVCPYTPPPDVTRYRYQRSIRLVEAVSGVTLDSAVLTGADPRQCAPTEAVSLTRLDGEPVSFDQVEAWLSPWVADTAMEPAPPTTSTTSTTLAAGIDDKVIAACAASCAGEVVAGAAPYAGPNPHPVVLLDPMGGESEWIDLLPREWWPVEVSDVQLVAVLGFEEEVVIEVCPYTPPPDVTRYRYQRSIRLVEAVSGVTLDSAVLTGADPRQCAPTEAVSLTRLDGEPVSFDQVEAWLSPWVTSDR
jgi:hypothetical protein